jgi:alpha/beta hydrolase fold
MDPKSRPKEGVDVVLAEQWSRSMQQRRKGLIKKPRASRLAFFFVSASTLALLVLFSFHNCKQLGLFPWRWKSDSDLGTPGSTLFQELRREFRWVDITPSRTIEWHPCYDREYDCARLNVPMDWLDPEEEEDRRVVLAIIRLRAANNTTDYRGPVFFNPGGPGGSGIFALRDHGKDLQTIVGDNHDIVSFDPRGIGASVPRIECWRSAQDRVFWDLQDVGVVDAHPGVVYDAYARAAAFSRLCEENLEESGILEHSSTTSHARDMLEILEQMGESKLKYWGFSYGTVLGGTFAALYPDKVERMVNDGKTSPRPHARY